VLFFIGDICGNGRNSAILVLCFFRAFPVCALNCSSRQWLARGGGDISWRVKSALIKADRLVRFGEFAFDMESDELYLGHERVSLRPQPARLLALFLAHHGRLLSQEKIAEKIWPDSVVEFEQRIRSAVRDIRTALEDDPESPRYIETVSKRGYRFIYPVDSRQPKGRGKVFWGIAGAAVLAVLLLVVGRNGQIGDRPLGVGESAPFVVAILPVRDLSSQDAGSFPVDGLTHELIARMARLAPERITIIGRTSAMKYKNSPLSVAEISAALGADYLLETTLVYPPEKVGPTEVRVSVTLVDAPEGRVVWGTNFVGTINGLQAFHSELALGVSRALRPDDPTITFTAGSSERAGSSTYDAYLAGLDLLNLRTREGRAQSYAFFSEVVRSDPEFAPAYLGIARSAKAAGRPDSESRNVIEKALELDETLAEAYYLRATALFFDEWKWTEAAKDFQTAIRLEPGRVEFHEMYAAFLRAGGNYAQAEAETELAIVSDPLSELVYRDTGHLFLSTERYRRAIEICQRGLALQLEDPSRDHECLLLAYLQLDDLTSAAVHARWIMRNGGAGDDVISGLSEHAPRELLTAFWQWRLEDERSGDGQPGSHFQMAKFYTALGRHEEALLSLERGLEAREFSMVFMMGDVLLEPLRSDPRFLAIARAVGIPSVSG
jgi:DNA-binding winged helix-turn-helix (wHTH) protein/TolB-like protein/Tfp pilus assembly protein PilF